MQNSRKRKLRRCYSRQKEFTIEISTWSVIKQLLTINNNETEMMGNCLQGICSNLETE